MRYDRLTIRFLKLLIFLGSIGLIVEGLFEIRTFIQPFIAPPSTPGQTKIIEHFLTQHICFPLIGLLLTFNPYSLRPLFSSKFASYFFATIATLVTIPEIIVSSKDLFRPYPFNLHSQFLESIQMTSIWGHELNLLQLQHLLLSHFCLMGTIIFLAFCRVDLLKRFAGPRTGQLRFE
jgi:hypothetical protein